MFRVTHELVSYSIESFMHTEPAAVCYNYLPLKTIVVSIYCCIPTLSALEWYVHME